MSRFFSKKYEKLTPYKPGEQPKDKRYIKLNTNESPYPPPKECVRDAKTESRELNLYSDPECTVLTAELAKYYNLKPSQVLVTNGSDEALDFAFKAFCDQDHPIVFPNITYGFYPVFADANQVPYEEIPLEEDFRLNVDDYCGIGKNIVFANPNAPTGIAISRDDVERIVKSNPDNIVIVDEAYVDFGAESAIPLIDKYDNLLVTQTFSKSRSLAGARVGYIMGNEELIADLHTLKYSTNPYNVNRVSNICAIQALHQATYYRNNCRTIIGERQITIDELDKRGFITLPSSANFIFTTCYWMDAKTLYEKLRDEKGILIRHFTREEYKDYNRITIGTHLQMKRLIEAIDEIREEMEIDS